MRVFVPLVVCTHKDENPELPGSDWDLNFSEQSGTTKVSITIKNESLARLEKMIEMGFQEGFTMTLKNLEDLLAKLSGSRGLVKNTQLAPSAHPLP
jgi:uncharacterized protein YndB with AHSA1/START domain